MKRTFSLFFSVLICYIVDAQSLEIIGNGNLRSGPSTSNEIICKVSIGMKVTQIDYSNDWYKVELGNKSVGWIYKSLIKIDKKNSATLLKISAAPAIVSENHKILKTSRISISELKQFLSDSALRFETFKGTYAIVAGVGEMGDKILVPAKGFNILFPVVKSIKRISEDIYLVVIDVSTISYYGQRMKMEGAGEDLSASDLNGKVVFFCDAELGTTLISGNYDTMTTEVYNLFYDGQTKRALKILSIK